MAFSGRVATRWLYLDVTCQAVSPRRLLLSYKIGGRVATPAPLIFFYKSLAKTLLKGYIHDAFTNCVKSA